jgi:hypothetical protein
VLQLRDARTDEVKPVALTRAGALRVHVGSADLRVLLVADLVRRVATLSHDLVVRLTANGTQAGMDLLNIHPAELVEGDPDADVQVACPHGVGLLVEVGAAGLPTLRAGDWDPLAMRLALLDVDYRKPVDLDDAMLDAADGTLARWRELVAQWARSPGAPMSLDVARTISAAFDNDLDASLALEALRTLETADSVAPGAKFETFAYADRFFGLDLARDIR